MNNDMRSLFRDAWRRYRNLPLSEQFKVEWIALAIVAVVVYTAIILAVTL